MFYRTCSNCLRETNHKHVMRDHDLEIAYIEGRLSALKEQHEVLMKQLEQSLKSVKRAGG